MTGREDAPAVREHLQAGDIVMADLRPIRGSEQDGSRPALVLTSAAFHERDAKAIICPITRNRQPWPTKVPLPEGLPVDGWVLVDQVRSLDRQARGMRRVGRVPEETLVDVRRILAALVGFESASGEGDQ
jgi:mRNA interferase MazF